MIIIKTILVIIIVIIIIVITIIITIRKTRKYWVGVQQGIASSHGERDPL